MSRRVEAPPSVVWDVISTHTGMPQWTPYRRAVLERAGQPERDGVGAIRSLHLLGAPTREEIIDFDPPRRLRYRLLSGLPFRDYEGEITVVAEGIGSRLTTDLQLRARIPGTHVFGAIAIRVATRAAARLAEKRFAA